MKLTDCLYNSLLYTPGKNAKTASGGLIYFYAPYVYATDGYVVLRSEVQGLTRIGFITSEEAKAFLKNEMEIPGFMAPGPVTFWADASSILDTAVAALLKWGTTALDGWPQDGAIALSPARLSKLSRLRPQGEYPIDFTYLDGLLAFRYGPDTFGVMSPLAREDQPKDSLW